MDRRLIGGQSALVFEWLMIGEDCDYNLHQILKESVSSSDSHQNRVDRRRSLQQSGDAQILALLSTEEAARNGVSTEPLAHRCVSSFSFGNRLAKASSRKK